MDNELIYYLYSNCKTKDELENELRLARRETQYIIDFIEETGVSATPITIYENDFKHCRSFSYALFNVAAYFRNSEDIIVRYSKPENKDTGEVLVCFQVLKSKVKLLRKYLEKSGEPIILVLESNKEIKQALKYFNSLGIKDENGDSLLAKDSDLSESIKNAFKQNENKIFMEIKNSSTRNDIVLDWYPVDVDFNAPNYDVTKEKIESIF
jgi:hypothetical protein